MREFKYNKAQQIAVAIDCVIFGFDSKRLSVLLVRRKVDPFKGSWSLIGEVPDAKTSMRKSANDILYKLTGLKDIYLSQLKTYGDVGRDPLERVISIVYYSLIRVDVLKNIDLYKYNAQWFEFNKLPELILDHSNMVEDAIERLRQIAKSEPLGFELLPKFFTLPQLQNLYECIYDTEFDSRNFRKKNSFF
jgi:ADP-ribose pyrophosphatase YjhB (NUDIX family)